METQKIWQKKKGKIKFKSYYVVWKLQKQCQQTLETQEFKSYYVVWKLEGFCGRVEGEDCLNRTM